MKEFFSITEDSYKFEIMDLFTFITILNVAFILMGFSWAPWLGILNCILNIIYSIKVKAHINLYIMQIALIILNAYFLTL